MALRLHLSLADSTLYIKAVVSKDVRKLSSLQVFDCFCLKDSCVSGASLWREGVLAGCAGLESSDMRVPVLAMARILPV